MVKTRSDVRNISRKTPRVGVTLLPRVVETLRGPGRMASTTAAAQMPASIWATKQSVARTALMAPMRKRPNVTCLFLLDMVSCLLSYMLSLLFFEAESGKAKQTKLTAGLNNPPLTRKKTHTLTIRLKPNIKLM